MRLQRKDVKCKWDGLEHSDKLGPSEQIASRGCVQDLKLPISPSSVPIEEKCCRGVLIKTIAFCLWNTTPLKSKNSVRLVNRICPKGRHVKDKGREVKCLQRTVGGQAWGSQWQEGPTGYSAGTVVKLSVFSGWMCCERSAVREAECRGSHGRTCSVLFLYRTLPCLINPAPPPPSLLV